jgi:hypothetical protein
VAAEPGLVVALYESPTKPGYDPKVYSGQLTCRVEPNDAFYEGVQGLVLRAKIPGVPEDEKAALGSLVKEVSSRVGGLGYNRRVDEKTRIRLTKYSQKAG